jgi:hypothetical protein
MRQVWEAIAAGSAGAIDFAVVFVFVAFQLAFCGCESVNCGRFGRQLRQVRHVQSILRCLVFCLFLLPFGLPCAAASQSIAAGAAGSAGNCGRFRRCN